MIRYNKLLLYVVVDYGHCTFCPVEERWPDDFADRHGGELLLYRHGNPRPQFTEESTARLRQRLRREKRRHSRYRREEEELVRIQNGNYSKLQSATTAAATAGNSANLYIAGLHRTVWLVWLFKSVDMVTF